MFILATGDVVDHLRIQGKEAPWNAAHVGSWGFWGQGHHTCMCHSFPPLLFPHIKISDSPIVKINTDLWSRHGRIWVRPKAARRKAA